MATQTPATVNINLSKLENRIDTVAAATKRIEDEISVTNRKLDAVSSEVSEVNQDLQELKSSFERFVYENRRTAELQKAVTELVRVRQELEQKYGGYKKVRETMLGVLQATDLALVKKTTVSQVTEELMITTPDYWLAPCLVAVSAWIGNDRDLANRAIAEAVKRDEEKTALTMALICRRNNRLDTCYEWLSIYFAKQSATNFTESSFTYLTAYLNGVFGPDEKHMCDDYIAKWMKELQSGSEDFEVKQAEQWRQYCGNFTVDLEKQFPQLSKCAHEYGDISAYVGRIHSVDQIANHFSGMKNVEIDQEKLKKDIDQTLVTLVSDYDTKEAPLRKKERYYKTVRKCGGDTAKAEALILEEDRRKRDDTIDLIGQMTNVIVKNDASQRAEQKTAVSFLSNYIRSGFENYITEKKASFPEKVTLAVEDWTGVATDSQDGAVLKNDFERHMGQRRAEALRDVQTTRPKKLKTAAIVLAALGAIFLFTATPLGIVSLAAAAICFFKSRKAEKDIIANTQSTNADFDARLLAGKQQIDAALSEWGDARTLVQTFESQKIRDIVA